jgi:hypothetical protein
MDGIIKSILSELSFTRGSHLAYEAPLALRESYFPFLETLRRLDQSEKLTLS